MDAHPRVRLPALLRGLRPVRHRRGLRSRASSSCKRIGVDEIACLIDYGIPIAAGARRPARRSPRCCARANAPTDGRRATTSRSPPQIVRHGVTHLQCTPEHGAHALHERRGARRARPRPAPDASAASRCRRAGRRARPGHAGAHREHVRPDRDHDLVLDRTRRPPTTAVVNIGTPIANTRLYVLDDALRAGAGRRAGRALHRRRRGRARLLAARRT